MRNITLDLSLTVMLVVSSIAAVGSSRAEAQPAPPSLQRAIAAEASGNLLTCGDGVHYRIVYDEVMAQRVTTQITRLPATSPADRLNGVTGRYRVTWVANVVRTRRGSTWSDWRAPGAPLGVAVFELRSGTWRVGQRNWRTNFLNPGPGAVRSMRPISCSGAESRQVTAPPSRSAGRRPAPAAPNRRGAMASSSALAGICPERTDGLPCMYFVSSGSRHVDSARLSREGVYVKFSEDGAPWGRTPGCVGFREDLGGTEAGARRLVEFLGQSYRLGPCNGSGFPYSIYTTW